MLFETFQNDSADEMLWSEISRDLKLRMVAEGHPAENNTNTEIIVTWSMAWESHHAPRRSLGVCWDSQVSGEVAVTETEVSISAISWSESWT